MVDEVGWLIEHRASKTGAPEYLCAIVSNIRDIEACAGTFGWINDHNCALRFSRQQDAVAFVGAMREASKIVPHGETLDGLRSGELAPRVCEHMWHSALTAGQHSEK